MCDNIIIISSYVDLINVIYFTAYSTGEHKIIELYFMVKKSKILKWKAWTNDTRI